MNSLTLNNDGKLALIESEMTFIDTYKGTLISKLCKENKGVTMKVVSYLLERLNDQFNMNLKLNRVQLVTASFDLLHKFKGETLEDIVLFFKMARLGELGNKMHRLDSHVIFNEWFPEYMNLKSINREDLINRRKESSKIDLNSKQQWSNENKEKLDEIIKSFEENKKDFRDFEKTTDKRYLNNSQDFVEKLKIDVKKMNLKELNEFKEYCSNRRFYESYQEVIEDEITTRT